MQRPFAVFIRRLGRTPANAGNFVDLAPIDGGGEDVLPSLAFLLCRYAVARDLEQIEWLE